jgi:phosphate transport system permease protein
MSEQRLSPPEIVQAEPDHTLALDGGNLNKTNIPRRHRVGKIWRGVFLASTVIGIIALTLLMINITNQSLGYMAIEYKVEPESLAMDGVPLEELPNEALIQILEENLTSNRFRTLDRQTPMEQRTQADLVSLVYDNVVKPEVEMTWLFIDSILREREIRREAAVKYPNAELFFKVWFTAKLWTSPQSSDPLLAGVRTAILGSLWIILITVLFALPVGTGAAIYLEEYARDTWLNRTIQTNINNLAGVPSIIYGMLGLAVFARALSVITSGAIFNVPDATADNGRTLLSAGLTLALLILPVVIINAQEAIRAVPNSLREASYGLGATKWQTIWAHVLPNSLAGIMTGAILSISRAFGETAPLVVIGAATFITFDPQNIFSKFTAMPIQIYQWTARPQAEFRNLAAAAILVLLILQLSINAIAIILRNRFSRRLL